MLLGHLSAALQKQAVRQSHDVRLVHGDHRLAIVVLRILERVLSHSSGRWLGDQFDALHNAVHNLVLDAAVLAWEGEQRSEFQAW